MTDHKQAAIEAGAEALAQHQLDGDFNCECGHEHPNGSGDNFPTWKKGVITHETKVTLNAALPHLREMIAEEIRDANLPNDPVFYSGADGYHLGIKAAARIAKGPQQ